MHLDNRLSDERRTEKRPERNEKVATRDASKVEERVGNLEKERKMKS